MFNAIEWILDRFTLEQSDSATFIYGTQETLSNHAMPGIYKPWQADCPIHFRLRGRLLDYAAVMGDARVLDFGPGEGFPSLPLAAYVREIVGVEGCAKRVEECTGNAKRLGVANARFVHVPPGQALPFSDACFDGAVASWSLEQSPDLGGTVREIFRVLRPGGVFRFEPETLGRYGNGQEQQVWLPDAIGGFHGLAIFDRDIAAEQVRHYGLLVDMPAGGEGERILRSLIDRHGCMPRMMAISEKSLEALAPYVLRAGTWTTQHPSFTSWPRWLCEAGFAESRVTYSGASMAIAALDMLADEHRPRSVALMDALLGPMARIAAALDAPVPPASEEGLFITARKANA